MVRKIEAKRREQQRLRCLENIPDSMDMSSSRLPEIVKAKEAWSAAAHGIPNSLT